MDARSPRGHEFLGREPDRLRLSSTPAGACVDDQKAARPASIGARRSFATDEHASILVLFALMLPAIIGMVSLALNVGSLYSLNNSLQELADAAALAGAAELDGSTNAIANATSAAQSLLTNDPRWSNVAASGVQITTPVYYSALSPDAVTTNPKDAVFVKVTTINRSLTPYLLTRIGALPTISTSATATAQATYTNCIPIQSFLCNPGENSETNKGNANNFTSVANIGTMVKLLNGSGSPGNWGLIDPPAGPNPHNLAPFWAQTSAGACGPGSPGSTRPGNVAKFAQDGMNVRFDAPSGSGDEAMSSPIVISGKRKTGNANKCTVTDAYSDTTFKQTDTDATAYNTYCNTSPSKGSCALPRDRSYSTTNIGSGLTLADLQAYWKNHHPGTLPAGVTTRWDLYQLEVNGTGNAGVWLTDSFESHAPSCNASTTGTADRRLINVAIVDCGYWGITGNKDLPNNTLFAKFFMTEPALSDGTIYGELVTTYRVNAVGGGTYQIVQLVR